MKKKRAENIGLIVLIICLFISLIFVYLDIETGGNKMYLFFGLLVIIMGFLGYLATRIYGAKQRHTEKINILLEHLELSYEEIEKRQDYLSNQSVEKLVEIEKILYQELMLKQNQKQNQKQMSDEEFFKPLYEKGKTKIDE